MFGMSDGCAAAKSNNTQVAFPNLKELRQTHSAQDLHKSSTSWPSCALQLIPLLHYDRWVYNKIVLNVSHKNFGVRSSALTPRGGPKMFAWYYQDYLYKFLIITVMVSVSDYVTSKWR